MVGMDVVTGDVTEYDGCGKCMVGVRRLSRKTDATNSPERQREHVLGAVESVGGHLIGWADDWEVSGATNPLDRPQLGPWLRDEMGPYSGIVGADVDRIGRNVLDVLATAANIKNSGRLLVTYGHDGPWNLDDSNDENLFTFKAMGAQMELRQIQKRNREETERARRAGEKKNANSYGYRYVRLTPMGKVDHIEFDQEAAEVLWQAKERLLTDDTGRITVATEAARLNRAAVLSPADRRAVLYGREPKGRRWTAKGLKGILTSEAALGYLLHEGRPVIGTDGEPIRIAPPLWDAATRDALIEKTAPKRTGSRAPKGLQLCSGLAFCGVCGGRLYITGLRSYGCTGRVMGLPSSAGCRPAPTMHVREMDERVAAYFLDRFGAIDPMRRVFDPGTGHAARIAELETSRKRLRADREAGLYDSADDTVWYQETYSRLSAEISDLKRLPDRPAGWHWEKTGHTYAERWAQASDNTGRRELLARYQVKIVLYPTGHRRGRLWIHTLDPMTEAEAIEECERADQERAEAAADRYDYAD